MLPARKSWIGLTTLLGVGVSAVWWHGRFDPETCSDVRLWRWLVQNDAAELPSEDQAALITRLEDEILQGLPWDGTTTFLSRDQTDRLQANVATLQHAWFTASVAEHQRQTTPQGRTRLLDRKLAVLMHWPEGHSADGPTPTTAMWFGQIQDWIRQAPASQQGTMQAAVQAATERWLATYDLQQQPRAVQEALAKRIADELNRGLVLSPQETPTDSDSLFLRNAQLLMQNWFRVLAAEYDARPPQQQTPWLDRRLDELFAWNLDSVLAGASDRQQDASAQLLALVQEWTAAGTATEQAQMQKLATAAQRRMVMRLLTGRVQENQPLDAAPAVPN